MSKLYYYMQLVYRVQWFFRKIDDLINLPKEIDFICFFARLTIRIKNLYKTII